MIFYNKIINEIQKKRFKYQKTKFQLKMIYQTKKKMRKMFYKKIIGDKAKQLKEINKKLSNYRYKQTKRNNSYEK